ncbi:hypothetical protein EGR_10444 [Echinococcus granulosus]|uniref:Uncharacterized protein n=1 Tax=Echinococcus granulosus TaxID=6210 RepID=W6UMI5_ECHGR|nr:hypothetical protein EGR_10444 [Echinococcus granulosus]EUB54704.1 hypothetical protein EGR_10444 [Echinococcus granulosus]
MFNEFPFVSASDSGTASNSCSDRDSQKVEKWKPVPTDNFLRIRLKKSVSEEKEKNTREADAYNPKVHSCVSFTYLPKQLHLTQMNYSPDHILACLQVAS